MSRVESDLSGTQAVTAIRINKYICESGICSRKAADAHVRRGEDFINGEQAMLGEYLQRAASEHGE